MVSACYYQIKVKLGAWSVHVVLNQCMLFDWGTTYISTYIISLGAQRAKHFAA